jgi:hypothetical protein
MCELLWDVMCDLLVQNDAPALLFSASQDTSQLECCSTSHPAAAVTANILCYIFTTRHTYKCMSSVLRMITVFTVLFAKL